MTVVILRADEPIVPQLIEASRRRAVLSCLRGGMRTVVAADAVREACARSDELDPFGVRVADARIEGVLDLRAFSLDLPVHFLGCHFTDVLRLDGADVRELVIDRSPDRDAVRDPTLVQFQGLVGNAMHVRGDLIIREATVNGDHRTPASRRKSAAIWLADARIDGRFLIVASHFVTRADRAIHADGLHVNGALRFIEGSSSQAEIRLLRASIGGSLDLSGATLTPANSRALDLSEAQIGSLFLIKDPVTASACVVRGRIKLDHARINGRVLVRGALLVAPPWDQGLEYYDARRPAQVPGVLEGPGAVITGDLTIEPDAVVRGGLVFPGARIGGVRAVGAGLSNPDSVALNLWRAEVSAGVDLRDAVIHGMINLSDAHVTGTVSLARTFLSRPPGRQCVRAIGLTIRGELDLHAARVRGGTLSFGSSTVSGLVNAEGAFLFNPGDSTLSLHQATIGGNVHLTAATSVGLLMLNRCDIAGWLTLDSATLTWLHHPPGPARRVRPWDQLEAPTSNDKGSAVAAVSATVRNGITLGWSVPLGAIDFTDARTSFLADDPARDWPGRAHLTGLTYERFAAVNVSSGQGVWAAEERIHWLSRICPADPRPWEQVARVLRSNGDTRGADDVLAAFRRLTRRHLPSSAWPRRAVEWLWDVTVRYGYRPQRALGVLLALVLALWSGLLPATVHDHLRAGDAVGAVYTPAGPVRSQEQALLGPCGDGRVRCFQPLFYAIDTVVPIIDLHQRSDWHTAPDPGGRLLDVILTVATILGWLLSTVFAIALTRLGRAP